MEKTSEIFKLNRNKKVLRMVIPKGRIFNNVACLLRNCGIGLEVNSGHYIPNINDKELEAKIMKPQNIPQLVELGSHDIGFTGKDWVMESGAKVKELLDLRFDPVTIVAAVPEEMNISQLRSRRIIVATEYENIARNFLNKKAYNYFLIRTYGASEAFPPQDADMVIDNMATGQTLKDHNLKVIDRIMNSSTCLIANPQALNKPWKKEKIEALLMLFNSVLNARQRVMLEMNVPPERMEEIVRILPCMRAPTVAPLYKDTGYAVKVAVKKEEVSALIPVLKKLGATDILEYSLRKVII